MRKVKKRRDDSRVCEDSRVEERCPRNHPGSPLPWSLPRRTCLRSASRMGRRSDDRVGCDPSSLGQRRLPSETVWAPACAGVTESVPQGSIESRQDALTHTIRGVCHVRAGRCAWHTLPGGYRVGGGIAPAVLPHHRAYGSVPRRFMEYIADAAMDATGTQDQSGQSSSGDNRRACGRPRSSTRGRGR